MKLNEFISELQKYQKEHGDLHINVLTTCNHKGYSLTKWQGIVTQVRVNHQYPDQLELIFSKELPRY